MGEAIHAAAGVVTVPVCFKAIVPGDKDSDRCDLRPGHDGNCTTIAELQAQAREAVEDRNGIFSYLFKLNERGLIIPKGVLLTDAEDAALVEFLGYRLSRIKRDSIRARTGKVITDDNQIVTEVTPQDGGISPKEV